MKSFFFIYTLVFLFSVPVLGQESFYFSQYNQNQSYFNPAYAGSNQLSQITVFGSKQFLDNPDGPKDYFFNFNTPLGSKLGVGLQWARQQTLANNYNEFGLDLAYHLSFDATATSRSTLSMGVHASYGKNQFNLNSEDSSLPGKEDNGLPNFGIGFLLHNSRSYIGLSVPRLMVAVVQDDGERANKLDFKKAPVYLSAGAKIPLSNGLVWNTSALLRYISEEPVTFDLTNSIVVRDFVELGLFYRFKNVVGLLSSFKLNKSFTVGYSYHAALLLEETSLNSGSHEFVLNYTFSLISTKGRGGRGRYKPRYRR
ncbi:MAG: PorP/SprF family type IX secretion system membrane protein [Cytophagales bacterium]|nr:PorP/SprF family type IX secretion system membrane protein [Cytophagales bacterium]